MIDIHNHIVYGVDDGSRNLDESIKMVELYKKAGFDQIIATSHYDKSRYTVDANEIKEKVSIINDEIEKRTLDFKVYPGHEIQVELDMIKKIKSGNLLTLNNSRYVLCELSFVNKPTFLKDLFYNLELEGYVPIIAHVERYPYVENNIEWLEDFIKMGVLIQINYSSIKSNFEITRELLERNMVHIIGTDSHQSEWRNPDIRAYKDEILKIVSEERFEILSTINPAKVINDEFISSEYDKIIKPEKREKKGIFNFWRRK
ncbi:tyrosine-protein phosphatase [Anaerococcus sp.]|uniref:tyrosine-protein phosphatase n=1 Tax=Anaerococcus sp. TaxID=1872515 RepID=UPI002903FDBC|nr:CpsB/CapC family capsule biosynthesis tyrosine phosphatase [Anaerococcus sp.]MDU1828577.1 CpsB/CapC family capsule biosynthesis tyrosine phosphatase [Anaerococcus sp.]MDU1865160.1 CpsB/CapC family capsule biosynthesis tyrosine phosphatase [Anaerococcus sp.]